MARPSDPRDIVTPDAFSVAPELLGVPLASRGKRLGAILLDLLLIAMLAQAGWLLLGGAALLASFRKGREESVGRRGRRTVRIGLAVAGSVILLISIGTSGLWRISRDAPQAPVRATAPAGVEGAGAGALLRERGPGRDDDRASSGTGHVATDTGSGARGMDRGAAETGRVEFDTAAAGDSGGGAGPRDPAASGGADGAPPGVPDDAEVRAIMELIPERVRNRPGVAEAVEQGLRAGTEAAREAEEPGGRSAAAGATEPGGRRGQGIIDVLRTFARDLGIGFGWGALYFTVFTSWWKGRTPAKRLFGIRVVRLDGKPLTWWAAFQRYGGYAVGFATGLLGFAQVYWDANRQATHDKICSTVVIRDGAPPTPGWRASDFHTRGDDGPTA